MFYGEKINKERVRRCAKSVKSITGLLKQLHYKKPNKCGSNTARMLKGIIGVNCYRNIANGTRRRGGKYVMPKNG